MSDLTLASADPVQAALADVGRLREQARQGRLRRLAAVLGAVAGWLWLRLLSGNPVEPGWPDVSAVQDFLPALFLIVLLSAVLLGPVLAAGRSPHVLFRPGDIDVGLDDVVGATVVRDEVVRTLNLFLAFRTFREQMGGTARRAILFEGPPGTGKTYMAKALARDAGVPFLFVSSSAFQSMYYGQTNRKIRSFFKALRATARKEGGAIGFIEEIDAIGAARTGMGSSTSREGISGVVNELLVQLQSFDDHTTGRRLVGWVVDRLNRLLPSHRQLHGLRPASANILVVGATNRAADLDPALLRPGRFDRSIHFGLPSRAERRQIVDFYLARKAHEPALDTDDRRDALAAITMGYSPVRIEHLLDEALVWALRRGAPALGWSDIEQAKLTDEIGLRQPVEYTDDERLRIATHEAGHATVAWAVGTARRLDVLSIVKRRDALGLLAHADVDERFTRTRTELEALVQIAMGGLVAEEQRFGEWSTGAAGDLEAATTAAAQMVGALGMGASLVSIDAMDVAGARNTAARVLATDHGRAQVERVLDDAKAVAERLVRSHAGVLGALRDALLEREELVGEEILDVIAAARAIERLPDVIDLAER